MSKGRMHSHTHEEDEQTEDLCGDCVHRLQSAATEQVPPGESWWEICVLVHLLLLFVSPKVSL